PGPPFRPSEPGRWLRHAHRRARPRRAVPPVARRAARRGHDRGGHQGRDVRARARPRPGGALGRRRRPARRAARPVSQRPRGARAARPPRGRGRADRRLRPYDRADPAGRGRLGASARPRPADATHHRSAGQARRRRQGARQGRGRDDGAAAQPGAANRQGSPRRRPCPHPGAKARLARRHRLRPLPHSGQDKLRATITGAVRTAEELGRAFPGVKVRTSGGDLVLPRVPDQPALVIATPGAEPLADYAAALLLDGWALLSRPSLRAGEETLRRWLAAAALVRPRGTVLVHADAALPATQALVRWDPVTFAERDLAERAELGFPPAVRMAAVSGESAAVASVINSMDSAFEILGPVPLEQPVHQEEEPVRALVRAPRAQGAALAKALQAAQAGRSARKEGGGVRVQLDPAELI